MDSASDAPAEPQVWGTAPLAEPVSETNTTLFWARCATAAASLGAAVIHAASISVHFDHGTRYGVAFVVMTAFGIVACLAPLSRGWRVGLWFALIVNAAIASLWFLATTRGVPGDEKEAVSMAGAVCTMLELAAITAAAVGLSSRVRSVPSLTTARISWRAPIATGLVAALLAVPGVATAADHDHDHSAADAAAHDDSHTASGATGSGASGTSSHDHPNQETGVSSAVAAQTITGIFSSVPAAAHAGGSGNAVHSDPTGVPCAPSDDQVAAADKLVADTSLALLHFRDPNTAVAEGYRPLGFEPNGVFHYINRAYLDDDKTLDPQRPESILYGRAKDGSLYPIGSMYMMRDTSEYGPRVGGCLTPWHRHGFPFAKVGETSAEMMHVWTVPVPGGPYAEHVEGEYARIYLGVTPIDTDAVVADTAGATGATGTSGATGSTVFERLGSVGTSAKATGFNISTYLNALNVHRDFFCADAVRARMADAIKSPAMMDRICDPVLNGPLPGATSPDVATLIKFIATTGK